MSEQERWIIKVVIEREGEEPIATWQPSIKSYEAELDKMVDSTAQLRTFNDMVSRLIEENPSCGSDVAMLDDSSIPRQERPKHRSKAQGLMSTIQYLVCNPPSFFEQIPHLENATKIYDELPELYQVAILKMCTSLASRATKENEIKEFELWQTYLDGLR